VQIKIYHEFYLCIVYIANEGCHVRIIYNVFFIFIRERKNELEGEIFEMLLTFSDFVAFKEMFLDFRAVSTCLLLYITHIIRAPPSINTLLLSHSIHNYYVV